MSIVPPTEPMRHAMTAMADGWELVEYRTPDRDYAALELGERTRRVSRPTVRGLVTRRMVSSPGSCGRKRVTYTLTRAGTSYVESLRGTPKRADETG